MHVLTKIFIVLVALLAVMLVPLVVVYAHNEDSFKAKFQAAEAQRAAAAQSAQASQLQVQARSADLTAQIEQLRTQNGQIMEERDRHASEVRRLETELAQARSLQSEINTKLATLATAVDAMQQLNNSLIAELSKLRDGMLSSEQKVVELEDVNRDIRAQLDVAVKARNTLQEELARLKDEQAKSLDTIARYAQAYGSIGPSVAAGGLDGIAPDRTMKATVVNVRRSDSGALVEIAAGSRDGVKVGWIMTLARGPQFVGRLKIIEVDINRSVGTVSLETADNLVQPGDSASAYAGQR